MKKELCECGGIILADTEEFEKPMCYECFERVGEDD